MIELCYFALAVCAILSSVSIKLWIDHKKCYERLGQNQTRLGKVEARLAAIEVKYEVP